MSTWLKLLPLELDGINKSDFIEPDHPLTKGDQEVGEMSVMSRQLYSLGISLEKAANQHNLDATYCNDSAKKPELEARATELMSKARILKELMWVGIRDEFGLWGENIGVRVGYKVVSRPSDTDIPPIMRLLGGLEL